MPKKPSLFIVYAKDRLPACVCYAMNGLKKVNDVLNEFCIYYVSK